MQRDGMRGVCGEQISAPRQVGRARRGMRLIQGWSLSPGHPAYDAHPPESFLPPSTSTLPQRDRTTYIQAHAYKLLTSPDLASLAPSAMLEVVSQPSLALTEDELLSHLLSYATRRLSLDEVTTWSAARGTYQDSTMESARTLLRPLLEHVRMHSLSAAWLRRLDELSLVPEATLLDAYREKALLRAGCARRCATRGYAVVAEMEHAVNDGRAVFVTRVDVETAPSLVEFDRRSGVDGEVAIFRDAECERLLLRWTDAWRSARSIKLLRVPDASFWITCRARGGWGWKLFAVPLLRAAAEHE